ncbi:hypothetical protein ACP4OV_011869 [Aristida adscensionis]
MSSSLSSPPPLRSHYLGARKVQESLLSPWMLFCLGVISSSIFFRRSPQLAVDNRREALATMCGDDRASLLQ